MAAREFEITFHIEGWGYNINKDVFHKDAPSSLINWKRQETREFPIEASRKEETNISTSSQVKSSSDNKYTGYHTAQKKQSTLLKKSLYNPALLHGEVKDRPKKRLCSAASMRLSSDYIAKDDIPVNTTDAKKFQNDPIETKVIGSANITIVEETTKYDIRYKTKNEFETLSEFTISDGLVSPTACSLLWDW